MRAIFAPDTNFFLQCKDADQLDWSLVCEAPSVLIVVLREVQKEIDRLKNGGNTRRSARARKLSTVLRDVIRSGQSEMTIRGGGPVVSIAFAPRLDPDRERPAMLDASSADDRVVEEALACSHAYYNGELVLLTNDMYPLGVAREVGQAAVPIPDEWLLPPEKSEQDKMIARLQQRVAALEGRAPAIDISAYDGSGRKVQTFEGEMPFYPPLTDDFIASALAAIVGRHPEKTAFSSPLSHMRLGDALRTWQEPSAYEISQYSKAYGKWRDETERRLGALADQLNRQACGVPATLVLANTGASAADRLLVDIKLKGRICAPAPLDDEDEDDEEENPRAYFELPPAPPQGRFASIFDRVHDPYGFSRLGLYDGGPSLNLPTPRFSRERHTFYWEYDDPEESSKRWRGECEDFRHGLEEERIALSLRSESADESGASGALKLIVSARNIAEPIETTFPVQIARRREDTEAVAKELLRDILGVEV